MIKYDDDASYSIFEISVCRYVLFLCWKFYDSVLKFSLGLRVLRSERFAVRQKRDGSVYFVCSRKTVRDCENCVSEGIFLHQYLYCEKRK